jgi:hypothetical protein
VTAEAIRPPLAQPRTVRRAIGAVPQIISATIAIPLGICLVLFFGQPWTTIPVLFAVVIAGEALTYKLAAELGDWRLQRMALLYAAKILLVLFLVGAGWLPQLNPGSEYFGYDPQRYYFYAQDLNAAGFDAGALSEVSLNYVGIVYYYAAIFRLLGSGAMTPALVNSLVVLLASMSIARLYYKVRPTAGRYDWLAAAGMMLPDVIWFDALTSRETLTATLLVLVATSWCAFFLIYSVGKAPPNLQLFIGTLAMLALIVVRLTAFVAIATAIGASFLLGRAPRKRRIVAAIGVCVFLALLAVAPLLSHAIGNFPLTYATIGNWVMHNEQTFLSDLDFGASSISARLIPHNLFETIAFIAPRSAIYFIAPLPILPIFSGLRAGYWWHYQFLMMDLSCLIYLAILPLAAAGLWNAIRSRSRELLVFQIPFLALLLAVGGGNQFVHERYRLMFVMFFWPAAILGFHARPTTRMIMTGLWFVALAFGGVAYILLKFEL